MGDFFSIKEVILLTSHRIFALLFLHDGIFVKQRTYSRRGKIENALSWTSTLVSIGLGTGLGREIVHVGGLGEPKRNAMKLDFHTCEQRIRNWLREGKE